MTSTDRFARTARTVSMVSGAFIVPCLLTTIALAVLGRQDEQITALEVHDDAELLDTVLVEEEIAALDTYSPVRVVVWTRDGAQSDNVDAETLEWVRGRPDDGLLSPGGRYWADGTLVVTLSVEEMSGTGSGGWARHDLQAHGYDHFQALNWDTGVVEIADAAAGEMARPAWTRFGITFGIPLILALLAAANIVGVRPMSRRFLRRTPASRSRHRTSTRPCRSRSTCSTTDSASAAPRRISRTRRDCSVVQRPSIWAAANGSRSGPRRSTRPLSTCEPRGTTAAFDDAPEPPRLQRSMISARPRSITGFYDRRSFYSPRPFIVGLAAGARSHRRAVEREKRVQSSGGSRTSYGASGGGFRGSGSSSRF